MVNQQARYKLWLRLDDILNISDIIHHIFFDYTTRAQRMIHESERFLY
jgi:hypothetical protein